MEFKPPSEPDSPPRVLSLKGASNFRDLGGYGTPEGQQVKWRVLYRSGQLSKLRGSGLRRFDQLEIHTLIDFRSNQEREKEPDRLPPGHHIRVLALPVFDEGNSAMVREINQRLKKNNFEGFDPEATMAAAYRQFALDFADSYRQFVHAILEADGAPVLWHCTAGKDRAGFAAALLLRLLGVEQQIVLQDYLLSAKHAPSMRHILVGLWLTKGAKTARTIKVFTEVKEHWIRAALQTIDERWGSFETYTQQALELSPADVANLRRSLLEPATL